MEDGGRRIKSSCGSISRRRAILYPRSSILCPQFLFPLLLPDADRPPGQFPNFEGTDDPAPVIGMQTRCRSRIDGGEALVQGLAAHTLRLLREAAAQVGVGGRTVK